jgi:hypothetical protein
MIIDSSGNVGIGTTTNITTKLLVNGDTKLNGLLTTTGNLAIGTTPFSVNTK